MTKRSERLNICLTPVDRDALARIAKRENRDAGYVAAQFVEWAMRQYVIVGASLVLLNESKAVHDAELEKNALARLVLRKEAQHAHEEEQNPRLERKRA